MTHRSEAVVVGGGVLGASVAYHLARRGLRRVFVCEQGRSPGPGATSRSGGLLRQHHSARCDIRLAVDSLPTFQRWSEEVGGDCGYRRTGFAVLVDARFADHLAKNVAAVNEAGGRSEVTSAAELAALHPGLRPPAGALAAYEPDGGYADPVATTLALLRGAAERGAVRGEGVVVSSILTAGGRVRAVETNVGRIHTPTVVLAAGAWSAALASTAGVDLPVAARRIGLARSDTRLEAGTVPVCIDDTRGVYFRPDDSGHLYFGVPTDARMDLARPPAPLTPGEIRAAATAVSALVPAAAASAVDGTRAGFDGYTPDRRPAIGPAGPDGLYVCAGFSGGGFKTAPAVGRLVADEIADGTREELLEPYRPLRFATGSLIESENPYERM